MNWGKALALALIAFAGMMTWFAVMASRHPEPLVTDNYYAEELHFQTRIEETQRARSLSAPVMIDPQRNGVQVVFPDELHGRHITGTLTLLRPNGPSADRSMRVGTDSARWGTTEITLLPGRYNATLLWKADGVSYSSEQKLHVP